MSLINDVLRDLEQRRRETPAPLAGRTGPNRPAPIRWPLWLLAAALAGGVLHWILDEQPTGEISQPVLVASSKERGPDQGAAPMRPAGSSAATVESLKDGGTLSPPPAAEGAGTGRAETTLRQNTQAASGKPALTAETAAPEPEVDHAPATETRVAAATPTPADPEADSVDQPEPSGGSRQPAGISDPEPSPAQTDIRIERAGQPETPGQDRLDDARRAYGRGHYSLAESQASVLVRDHPQLTDAHLLLARALLRQGRIRSAIDALDHALAVADAPARPAALLGRTLVERGEIARARAILELHKPDPMSDPDYHLLLAATLHQAGDHEAAAAAYRRLGDIIPGNTRVWIGLGTSLESLGRDEGAIAAYERALEGRDPRAAGYARQRIEQLK